ncbi:MAG: hypothetical protein LBV12_01320 [Puniceicoccales bacterium]|jgi:hypothetical protein|nr:hypothetical protein [Puniceicoccales bacterium]
MKNLLGKHLLFLFLSLIATPLCFSQKSPESQKLDEEFLDQVETLTQASMLKRAEEDARYAQWLKTDARDSAKIKAGDLALAKKLIEDGIPRDIMLSFADELALNKLALSGNPQVILLLEDHLKSDFKEMWKWMNAERIICKLVYYSPELTNFAKLERVPSQPFFQQPNFLNERAMPRSAWIRWFDANKEHLIAKKYSEVELFSYYRPIYKEGVKIPALDYYLDNGYEPNSAPIDIENRLKQKKEQSLPSNDNDQTSQLKRPARQVSYLWVGGVAALVASGLLFVLLRSKRKP